MPTTSAQFPVLQGANRQQLLGQVSRAYRSAALTCNSGAWTRVPLGTVDTGDDPAGNVSIADRLTLGRSGYYVCPAAGAYDVDGVAAATAAAIADYALSAIYLNGALDTYGALAYSPAALATLASPATAKIRCAANDVIELYLFVGGGHNLALLTGKASASLMVQQTE